MPMTSLNSTSPTPCSHIYNANKSLQLQYEYIKYINFETTSNPFIHLYVTLSVTKPFERFL
jgi:hypothetical protein